MSSDSFHWIQEMMMMSFGSIMMVSIIILEWICSCKTLSFKVVIRKSEKRQKASVLVKKEGCSEQAGRCDK